MLVIRADYDQHRARTHGEILRVEPPQGRQTRLGSDHATTLILGALLVAGALTIPTPAATAVGTDCTQDLAALEVVYLPDSTSLWEIQQDGSIDDGGLVGTGRTDSYDDFTVFAVDDGTNGREDYTNPAGTCTYEAGGRQVAFPTQTTVAGLQLSRKVYVPASGASFARFYNQVTNPTGSAMTITVYTADGEENTLGSDSATIVRDSSAGPGVAFVGDVLDTAVSWLTTSDPDPDTGDPVLAHNLDAGFSRTVKDRVDSVQQDGGDTDALTFEYQNVTVPAGGTVSYLSFEAQRANVAAAGDAARFMDASPAALFTGLSVAEAAATQNWDAGDIDGDGVLNATDNCPGVASPNLADTDNDGQGDVCDNDVDGDGIAERHRDRLRHQPAQGRHRRRRRARQRRQLPQGRRRRRRRLPAGDRRGQQRPPGVQDHAQGLRDQVRSGHDQGQGKGQAQGRRHDAGARLHERSRTGARQGRRS